MAKKISLLVLFISAGLVAYGVGLYQGHKYRLTRSLASEALPSNTQSNIENQK